MTQISLAERADISVNYLSHIENGLSKFSFNIFIKIVNALNVTPNKLLLNNIENRRVNIEEDILMILEQFDNVKLEFILMYLEDLSKYDVIEKK